MSEFVATLRSGIEQAQRAFVAAHRARLKDLLAVAGRTGVNAERSTDPGAREEAR